MILVTKDVETNVDIEFCNETDPLGELCCVVQDDGTVIDICNPSKNLNIDVNTELDTEVDIDIDKDLDVDLNFDSDVDISGNLANLTFDVTAIGDNSFAEADVSVFTNPNVAEVSGSFVAAVDDFGRPILDDDKPVNEFDIDDFNDDFEGTIGEKDIYNFNILSPDFDNPGQITIIGFEADCDEIRFNFNMEATRYAVEGGEFGPFGEMFVNDEIFFEDEISGGFKKETDSEVELLLPAIPEEGGIGTVFEMGTNVPFADVTYSPSPFDFVGGTILIESLVGSLGPDNLVFLNEMSM